jgi:O-antigen ligase
LVNAVATLLSPYPDQAQSGMIMLLQGTLFMMVVMLMINERGFEVYLPWTIGLSMGVAASMAVLGYFFGVELFLHEGVKRAYGATISANNMALMCVFAFPIGIYWAVYGRSMRMKVLGMTVALLMVLGIMSTVSRGGFLNLVLVAGLLALQYRKRFHLRYLGLIVGAIGVLAVVFIIAAPKEFLERQATLVTEGTQDRSVNRRSHYVKVGLEAIKERPLIGWGPDVFRKVWVHSMDTRWFDMVERPAHNTYIEVGVGSGLIGLFLFLFVLGRAYFNYRQAERTLMEHGMEEQAHLVGAFKLGIISVLIYFFIKSGLEHKYFLLSLALSYGALLYARNKVAAVDAKRTEVNDGRGQGTASSCGSDRRSGFSPTI